MARTRLRGISIAGIQIGIEVPEVYEWDWPESPVSSFQCLPREPEVHVGLRVDAPSQVDLGGDRYSVGAWTFEVARLAEGDWMLGLSKRGRREKLARFDREFRTGEIIVSAETARTRAYPLRCPIDEWIVLHRTLARGGLCLSASAEAYDGGARLRLGEAPPRPGDLWSVPRPSLLGRSALLVREDRGCLRLFRTPWSESIDPRLPFEVRVHELESVAEADLAWADRLEPADAADLLARHAIVPLCDEGLLERVLRNAQRIAEEARIVERGITRYADDLPPHSHAPIAPARALLASLHG
ncbi:MAG: hypothetical protein ACPGVZ_09170 [Myxococcota bacterium]